MDVSELFRKHEATISAQAESAGIIKHAGDRGKASSRAARPWP
jgi:hypothetical protein